MAASSSAPSPKTTAPVLNSWKQIAAYLGRGVRTVQRYEHEFSLPVRRLGGKSRRAVVALPGDLDVWLRSVPVCELRELPMRRAGAAANKASATIEDDAELRRRCETLRAANNQALSDLFLNLTALMEQIEVGCHVRKRAGFHFER
jgi:hypothetical protein